MTKLSRPALCPCQRNAGWRELYDGFVPDIRVRKLIQKGLFRWWRAELTNLRLILQPPQAATTEPIAEVKMRPV